MSARRTTMRLGLSAVILLLANILYFSRGFHPPIAWVCVGLDVIFVVSAIVAFSTANRGR